MIFQTVGLLPNTNPPRKGNEDGRTSLMDVDADKEVTQASMDLKGF